MSDDRDVIVRNISEIGARARDHVRGNPDEYRDAGAWFDDHYSYAACRRRAEVDRAQVRKDCPVGAPIRRATTRRGDYTPTARLARVCRDLRGKYLDKTGALDAGLAMSMDMEDARRILILAWLLFDPDAHLIKPALCDFATLPWAFDAVVNRVPFQGRQNISDRLADDPWAKLASVAGAKVMGEAPPAGSTTPMSCEDLAKRHKLPFDALRKRLERERAKNHGCYIEMGGSERRPRDPKYLYHQAKVHHIIDDMKDG